MTVRANAREVALQVLRRVLVDQAYSDLALNAAFHKTELNDHDRALTTELVYGVLRHRSYLDWCIERVSRTPISRMETRVADAMRLGVYQLLFLERVPAYAAVGESVHLVPRRAAGLVNAVLRKLNEIDHAALVPNGADPLAAAAIRWSHPEWLLRAWADAYGLQMAADIAADDQLPPAAVLRVNLLQTTRAALLERLREFAPAATKHSAWGVEVTRLEPVLRHQDFADGAFLVQSEASQLVSELTGARPGERILDLCAAPGGKTTHLAGLVSPDGQVVAADVRPARLRLIYSNLKRLNITNVTVRLVDGASPLEPSVVNGQFDRVLVDAPCTALGTLAKHPEIKWQINKNDPARLSDVQVRLCANAAACVRPGGVLLYSVCTLSEEETRGVVRRFLAECADFRLDDLRAEFAPRLDAFLQADGTFLSLPPRTGTEGMFAARFVRS
jgi:16S rRNA (cytosine967-C5)-methyltransferase